MSWFALSRNLLTRELYNTMIVPSEYFRPEDAKRTGGQTAKKDVDMRRRVGPLGPRILCLAAVALMTAVGGCLKYTTPIAPGEPAKLSVADRNYDAVWQAAIQVLRSKYYFRINRRDAPALKAVSVQV